MSLIEIKGAKSKELVQKIMLGSDEPPRVPFGNNIKFWNSHKTCIVCGGERTFDTQTRMCERLYGHHVKYFPQEVAWVHYSCHQKIHDVKNPITIWIQYSEGDSRKFYKQRNQRKYGKNTSEAFTV